MSCSFIPSIKDTDGYEKTVFESGAVRDIQVEKGRCDLLPLDVVSEFVCESECTSDIVLDLIYEFMVSCDYRHLIHALIVFCENENISRFSLVLELSSHFKAGSEKYGERNWEKGLPVYSFIDSGVRHYLKYIDGYDDERHDRAFAWNLMCACWTMKHNDKLKKEFCESVASLRCDSYETSAG